MMKDLTKLEQSVLDKLLCGNHPDLVKLRGQLERARFVGREHTGVGFFCSFEVPPDVPVVTEPADFQIGDIDGDLDGLVHGAGFVLFIRDGRLDILEGFSYDESWPPEIRSFELTYQQEPRELQFLERSLSSNKET